MTDHLADAGKPIPTLELVDALENAQAELLRSKAHAEMRRMDDEALMRQALNALDPPAQLRFGGTENSKRLQSPRSRSD